MIICILPYIAASSKKLRESARVTGKVRPSTNMDGFGVNRALEHSVVWTAYNAAHSSTHFSSNAVYQAQETRVLYKKAN